jgi:cell division inhibitor SepF
MFGGVVRVAPRDWEVRMGVVRKAGVWLGLIEDDDDREYYDDRGYDDDYTGDDSGDAAAMIRARVADRLAEQRAQRETSSSVRSMSRTNTVTYPTRENLALAVEPPEAEAEPETHAGARPAAPASSRPSSIVAADDRRYQITTLHPTSFSEGRTIGEHFRDGVPVILNLTEMAEADAKRLVDFAAGLAFGLRGTMERVTNRVFLLSPANVQVTAEDKAKIAEGGFFYPN